MTIYEDEIDLRPYINAVLKEWWKIGILAISLAVLVFLFTQLQQPTYQSTATLLVPRSQLQLSLADQFPTIVDSGNASSRMDAYLTIARSAAIAQQTYQTVQSNLPEEYTVRDLRKNVEVSNTGDAILITATAPSAQLSAEIANEWAKQTAQAINLAYSGEQPLEEIQFQIAAAGEKYQETQSELETFIEANPITEIQTALTLAEAALNSYINDEDWQINYLYQQKQLFTQVADQATFLKNQIENGNSSLAGDVGDALAVMTARASGFPFTTSSSSSYGSSTINLPYDISLQLTDPTSLVDSPSAYAQDIETIIALSDAESQRIDQEIETLETDSYLDVEESYAAFASDIQMLKAQLENYTAQERELTSERDLAWDTYQVLLQKETEIKTTAHTNDVVTFASEAIPPREPESKQTLMKTAIAGIVGGMLGVLWVVVRMWWQSTQITDEDGSELSQE